VRVAAALVASLLALGLAGVATARGARVPGFLGCRSFFAHSPVPLVRLRSIVLACGDGNFYVTGLRWTRWDAARADGVGTGHENDCTPYCAAGHFHTYRVAVRLDRPRVCGARRAREFTRVSWAFTARKPRGAPRSGSETFRCR
jgi:hypothetical protein